MEKRFLIGVALIVLSLVIGKAMTVLLVLYYWHRLLFWLALTGYLCGWLLFFSGLYLCGRAGLKYAERFTKYLTPKYYHGKAKERLSMKRKPKRR